MSDIYLKFIEHIRNLPKNKQPLNTKCKEYKLLMSGKMSLNDSNYFDAVIRLAYYVRDYADGNINDSEWSNMRVLAECLIQCIHNTCWNVQDNEGDK